MIRRFFFTFCLMIGIATSVVASDIRFVQVAEMSYAPDKQPILEACVEDINTLKNIDFVVFTGDNILSAKKDYLRGFLRTVKRLKSPVYLVIGDRDVSKEKGLNKESYREESLLFLGFGQSLNPNYVFKKKGVVFIVVDGAKEFITAQNGYYKKDTLEWLDKQLTKYHNKNVVIIQHFPLIDGDVAERNAYKIDLYREMLAKHSNVSMVVSGHYNQNVEIVKDGVFHVVTPSYSSTKEYKVFDIPANQTDVYTQLRHVE